ncbi:MAG: helix-turn-helix domain-containing protein [Telluria sp.]
MDKDFITEARMDEQTNPLDPAAAEAIRVPLGDLRQLRISKRESQEKFWGRFGVTQSSGSRFETGLSIPAPVAILLKLYVNGKLNDGDLQG